MPSKIEWTTETWNVVISCSRVSLGCENCYAETMARRLAGMEHARDRYGHVIDRGRWSGRAHLVEEELERPLRWKKPRLVFVSSMGDLFHETVPDDWLRRIFRVMRAADRHVFQIITKREGRLWTFLQLFTPPISNVWAGVSAETDFNLRKRLPPLLDSRAAVRFLSLEPLLEEIEIPEFWLDRLDWVIVGGESGHLARPCRLEWIESVVHQCHAVGTPVFVKQLGTHWARGEMYERGVSVLASGDRRGADPSHWPEELRVREWPEGTPEVFKHLEHRFT